MGECRRILRRSFLTPVLVLALAAVAGCSAAGSLQTSPTEASELVGGPDYPLFDHTLTWTGQELIVLGGAGGDPGDGRLVDDPLAWEPDGGFRPISSPPGPPRNRHGAIWTGDEVVIWSGSTEPFGVGNGLVTTTSAYEPSTDTWRTLAPSPPELGRVGADATRVGRTIVFAGGTTPRPEDEATLGLYDLDNDRWTQTRLNGPALAVAGDGTRAFVLLAKRQVGDSDDGSEQELSISEIDVASANGTTLTELSFQAPADPLGVVDLVLVDGRLAVWTSGGEGSTLAVSTPLADQPIEWTSHRFSEIRTAAGPQPLHLVGDWIVTFDYPNLVWIDPLDGSSIVQALSTEQHCALESGAAATDTQLIAIGGWCSRADDDGVETNLFGSFAFEPPKE